MYPILRSSVRCVIGAALFALPTLGSAQTWEQQNDGLVEPSQPVVLALTRQPDGDILIGTRADGIYRSSDEGKSWAPDSLPYVGVDVYAFATGPDGHLYAATSLGVMHEEAEGVWVDAGLGELQIVALVATDSTLLAATTTRNGDGHIYRGPGRDTWSGVAEIEYPASLSLSPDGHLYAGQLYGGLLRSLDGGTSWTEVADFWVRSSVVFIADTAYVAGDRGLYRSTDDGLSWARFAFADDRLSDVAVTEDNRLLVSRRSTSSQGAGVFVNEGEAWTWLGPGRESPWYRVEVLPARGDGTRTLLGTSEGVVRSEGEQFGGWQSANEGFQRPRVVTGLAEDSEGLMAITSPREYGSETIYRRSEGGSWTALVGAGLGEPGYGVDIDHLISIGDTLFAGWSLGLAQSADGGASWTPATIDVRGRSLAVSPSGALVLGTYLSTGLGFIGEAYRSADRGTNWRRTAMLPGPVTDSAISADGTLYMTMHGGPEDGTGGMVRSDDDGQTWVLAGLDPESLFAVATAPDGRVYAGGQPFFWPTGNLYWSDDRGATWSETSYPPDGVSDLVVDSRGVVYAARAEDDAEDGLYVSADGGATWSRQLETRSVYSLLINRLGYLYAATDRGVYRTQQPLPVADAGASSSRFALELAYPNPVRTMASIPFQIPTSEHVTLAMYDVLGRRAHLLVQRAFPPGNHTVRWDARNVAPGTYTIHLAAGDHIATQRISVVR
ncbi:MAG: hypothetical protein Rubg2KO_38820 [Rubricoccaceae bacterium]